MAIYTTVVILTESMRQVGPENKWLVQILVQLREEKCNENDYDLLSSWVLKNIHDINWNDWKNTPVIVSENAQRDAINKPNFTLVLCNWHTLTNPCNWHGSKSIPSELQFQSYKSMSW
jgi:hypothetical protein